MSDNPSLVEDSIPEKAKGRGAKRIVITVVIAVAIVVVLVLAILLSPRYSPLASVHDADGDGVADSEDMFPDDPDESRDSDGDGSGDNGDAFPDDASETADTDGDGYGDSSDEFPNDDEEWEDTDGDGYGDNGDAFPNDSSEWLDSDDDGVGDNSDAFPTNPTQWADRDGDGYGDNPLGLNPDEFPDDPTEWRDTDSDGTGDNADFYDSGNGKIKISITLYQGDGSADFWTSGDPYFIIRVDTNDDGTYEVIGESNVFVDTERIVNPYSLTVDINDGTPVLRFVISVYDDDIDTSDVIDYTPTTSGTAYSHLVLSPFTGSWSYDGDDDGLSEIDCELEYSISVTT
jgi:hypothetical protein